MITKEQVKHIAKLVRLKLTESEIEKYQKQLGEILDYVGQLKKVNTKKVKPYTGGTNLKNVFRNDRAEIRNQEQSQKLINQAPRKQRGLIKTKGVFYAR